MGFPLPVRILQRILHSRLFLGTRFRLRWLCLLRDFFATLCAKRDGASQKGSAAIGTVLHKIHSLSEFPALLLSALKDRSR